MRKIKQDMIENQMIKDIKIKEWQGMSEKKRGTMSGKIKFTFS